MNIGSFLLDGVARFGVFQGDGVAPAAATLTRQYPCLRDLLDAQALHLLSRPEHLDPIIDCRDIVFLPPIPNPRKIICVGMNYPKPYPVEGVAPPDPTQIILFGKERDTLVGHGAALERPRGAPAQSFDYEGEIAAVIGKPVRNIGPERALDHLLGYSVFNDGSVREWQKHSIYAGKNFSNSGSWGPWITTADALPAVQDLHLEVRLNDAVVQSAFGRDMIFPLADQIAYASNLFTLQPGDVIATGSPDGTGASQSPKRFLRPGDTVRLSVAGVGTLTNTVTDQDV